MSPRTPRPSACIILAALLAGCTENPRSVSDASPQPSPACREESATRAPLGRLKHRDRFYDIHDLMDEEYRAASDDPFVHGFDPDRVVAPWAGLDPRVFDSFLD